MKGSFTPLVAACLALTSAFAKADDQPASSPTTHGPEQLGDFILPSVVVDGLKLDAALAKLKAAYEDVCRKTGETPLALTFAIAPGNQEELHLSLHPEGVEDSVGLLASVAGLKVERKGLEYHFTALEGDDTRVKQSLSVPPDFGSYIDQLAISPAGKPLPIGALLTEIGLISDPEAKISLSNSGELNMSNIRKADAAAIADFTRVICTMRPKQLKFTVKVVELEKDAQVEVRKTNPMTGRQSLAFQQEISGKKGVNLSTLPTVTARIGQSATIEIVRDFPDHPQAKEGKIAGRKGFGESVGAVGDGGTGGRSSGSNDWEEALNPNQVGQVAEVEGSLVGLKLDVKLHYTDRVGEIDPATQEAVITNRTDITDTDLYKDGSTQLLTQIRPDGSKTLLLAKAELIDATGRPYREND
ncbi:MAG: hypothetical protein ABIS50_07230 [Luteolibacter sp.]